MNLRCPECGSTNRFVQMGTQDVERIVLGSGEIEAADPTSWNPDGTTECEDCGHSSDTEDFEATP